MTESMIDKPRPHVSLITLNRTQNLQEAIAARKQKHRPRFED